MAKPKEKELGGARSMSKGAKILVVVFAVLMALSMMLPSLAPIFAGSSVADEGTTEQADTSTDDESTKEEAKDERPKRPRTRMPRMATRPRTQRRTRHLTRLSARKTSLTTRHSSLQPRPMSRR